MDSFGNNGFESSNKKKCEELRQIRVKMADTLGVPNVVRREPCNFEGECKGTCPACYMEEKALMDRIYALYENGMMDMLFGEDIKILEKNIVLEDDFLMGEAEPYDYTGDIDDYGEIESVSEIDKLFNAVLDEDETVPAKSYSDSLDSFGQDKGFGLFGENSSFGDWKGNPVNNKENNPMNRFPLPGMVVAPPTPPIPAESPKQTKKLVKESNKNKFELFKRRKK